MADIQFCVCFVQIIYILIGAAAISVVALVYSATSENPLEKFDEKYPDIIPNHYKHLLNFNYIKMKKNIANVEIKFWTISVQKNK